MIAATASVHRLTVVTRNVADFAGFGVRVLNPFKRALLVAFVLLAVFGLMAARRGGKEIDPSRLAEVYRRWIIPMTRAVEVEYLLAHPTATTG